MNWREIVKHAEALKAVRTEVDVNDFGRGTGGMYTEYCLPGDLPLTEYPWEHLQAINITDLVYQHPVPMMNKIRFDAVHPSGIRFWWFMNPGGVSRHPNCWVKKMTVLLEEGYLDRADNSQQVKSVFRRFLEGFPQYLRKRATEMRDRAEHADQDAAMLEEVLKRS